MSDDSQFTLDLKVNTKDANKQLDKTKKKVEDTAKAIDKEHEININGEEAQTTLKGLTDQLDALNKKVDEVSKNTKGLFDIGKLAIGFEAIKGVFKLFKAGYDVISNTAHEVVKLSNSAQSMRMSASQLKGWQDGFEKMGMHAEDANNALSNMNNILLGQMFNPSMQVASAFGMMGINLNKANGELKTGSELLFEMSGRYKKLSLIQAQALGQQFGQSPELVTQLRNAKNIQDIEKFTKRENVTETQIEQAKKIVETETELSLRLDELKRDGLMPVAEALNKIAPAVNKIADGLLGTNMNEVKDFWTNKNTPSKTMGELTNAGKLLGMSKQEIDTMLLTAQKESGMGVRTKNAYSNAQGIFQWQPKTWQSSMQNAPMTTFNEAIAYNKMYHEFTNFAKKNKINPTSEQYTMYHMLGATDYRKAVDKMKDLHHSISMRDVFNQSTNKDTLIKQNPNILNRPFPYSGLEQSIPMSAESSSAQSTINNHKTSNISSATNIGTMNVHANNPQQLANAIRQNTQYLDRISSMNGQLA